MHAAAFGLTAAIFFCCPIASAQSSHRKSELAYARAEKIQRHLEAKPLSVRTREDYERALNAYRTVYHGDPASPDAGRSIAAVADLLAAEGRCFHDAKLSRDAIAQWEFLRREYPGSPLRQRALFQEAQIEQHDLRDHAAAKKIYRSFLAQYPHYPLAEQARANLKGVRVNPQNETASRMLQPIASPGIPQKMLKSSEYASAPPAFSRSTGGENPPRPQIDEKTLPHRASSPSYPAATIQTVRYWAEGASTRLAIDMNGAVPYHAYLAQNGKQITLIFFGAHFSRSLMSHSISVQDANLRSIHPEILTGDQAEIVLELSHPVSLSSFTLSNPDRLILDIQAARPRKTTPAIERADAGTYPPTTRLAHQSMPAEIPVHRSTSTHFRRNVSPQAATQSKSISASDDITSDEAQTPPEVFSSVTLPEPAASADPTADGQRSMTRVLGLRVRRIVIDAGHGGHDSGTLGPGGLEEKDVALDVALRLGHLLHRRLGADVIYTRRTDKFISLEERTAIANRAHADLFISIHANSSSDPDVRGVETYFLNFTTSPDALQVAARENATSDRSVHELSDLVRKIALSDKIDESREFAADVQQSLYDGLAPGNPGLKNRGVKQAPFAVLIGAHMPSILAEISFLTNSEDAAELAQPAYRERLAESLYQGVAMYVEGMSGIRVAKTAPSEALPAPAE